MKPLSLGLLIGLLAACGADGPPEDRAPPPGVEIGGVATIGVTGEL